MKPVKPIGLTARIRYLGAGAAINKEALLIFGFHRKQQDYIYASGKAHRNTGICKIGLPQL